jgi:transposase
MANTGYDVDLIVQAVRKRDMRPVIVMSPKRKHLRCRNSRALYPLRGQVECMFHRLRRFRTVATGFEKTTTNQLAVVHIACMMPWLK